MSTNLRFLALALLAGCGPVVDPAMFTDATCTKPGEVHVLSRDEPGVTSIVLDGKDVYWSSRRGPRRVHRDGGVVVDLMLPHPDYGNPLGNAPVGAMGIDESYIWFGVWGALWRIPRGGGVAELFAGGNDNDGSARQLVHDDEYVWWVDFTYDTLFRVEKRRNYSGFYIQAFARTADEPVAAAIDGETVWFGRSVVGKDGFGSRIINMAANPEGIEVLGDSVYWTVRTGRIARFPKDGSEPQSYQAPAMLGDLTSHAGKLFFAIGGVTGGYGEIAPDGTGLQTHDIEEAHGAHFLAVDDEAVFLTAGEITTDIVKVCR